jgi:dienelactone hydrolase
MRNAKRDMRCAISDTQKCYLFLLLFLFTGAQARVLIPVKPCDTIVCKNNPGISYCVFRPDNYKPSGKWPVIFIFDPEGKGSVAIESFKAAAAGYGYILAAPNTSTFGSLDKILENADIVMDDLFRRYSVDSARIYTTGFSSGSRTAMAVAVLNDHVSAVIGCGAGMPAAQNFRPGPASKLIYYGFVGDEDMNYLEMCDLEVQLKAMGLRSRLNVFHGGHRWPSPELLSGAVEWIVLQEMRAGKRVRADTLIRNFYEKMITVAENRVSEKELVEAARNYHYLLDDFPDQPGITKYSGELTILESSKEYKKAVKDRERIKKKELGEREDYLQAFDRIIFTLSLPDTVLYWWQDGIGSLKKAAEKKDPDLQRMSLRLLNMITATSAEWGWTQMDAKGYKAASCLFRIWTVCEPDEIYPWFSLARAYGYLSDTKQCVSALRESLKHGQVKKQRIMNDAAFESVKSEKTFKELINQIQ